jgi:hypothetical protein
MGACNLWALPADVLSEPSQLRPDPRGNPPELGRDFDRTRSSDNRRVQYGHAERAPCRLGVCRTEAGCHRDERCDDPRGDYFAYQFLPEDPHRVQRGHAVGGHERQILGDALSDEGTVERVVVMER